MPGVFAPRRGGRESRMLTFISPPVGAYTQALQDWSSGDPEGALRQATVWACVTRIAYSMLMFLPRVFRSTAAAPPVRLAVPDVLTQPSSDCEMPMFTFSAWLSLLLRGNVYGVIAERDRRTLYPTQIELQHPDQMRVSKNTDGIYEYRLRNELIEPSKVWHKAINRMPGSRVGMSPISYAAATTRRVQAAEKFGGGFFEDGAHPSGILTNKNAAKINQEQARKVKEAFVAAVHGSREPVVMGSGWDYQQIQVSPSDSQFIESMQFGATDICRFFGMRPEYVGHGTPGSSITYANVEQNGLDFLQYPLTPYLILWDQWLGEWLPAPQYVTCDTKALLRTDMLTRWQAYHMAVGSRVVTQDEVRGWDDMPPLTDQQRAEVNALVMPLPPPVSPPKQGE